MVESRINNKWTLHIASNMWEQLENHIFPGDGDEHGAVIAASPVYTEESSRLLARKLFIAKDGVDYLPEKVGYRSLNPDFIHNAIDYCVKNGLAYIAIHCHGGQGKVAFSSTDNESHEITYPALLDILNGLPVVGLVLAKNAAAGDIWLPNKTRVLLSYLKVPGYPERVMDDGSHHNPAVKRFFNRQTLIFGEKGQETLAHQKVGVIGAGGIGSLLTQYLSRLGVGHIVNVDPENVAPSNYPRLVGSKRRDFLWLNDDLLAEKLPRFLFQRKVSIANRVAKEANSNINFEPIFGDISEPLVADKFIGCDFIFLAADSMTACLIFNALINQYLIPGAQVGVKVSSNEDHKITDIYTAVRMLSPGQGCLWCNNLIRPDRLNDESKDKEILRRQRYIDDERVNAPSVITLNSVAAGHAVNNYLFSLMGLSAAEENLPWAYYQPLEAGSSPMWFEKPIQDANCSECSAEGRLAKGDTMRLPTKFIN